MTLAKIVVSGKIVKAPEKRFTQSNIPIISFAIDINEKDSTIIRVVKFGASAERIVDEISTGDLVIVDGRPQMTAVTDQNGKERRVIEINATTIEKVGAGSDTTHSIGAEVSQSNVQNEDIVKFAEQSENVENLIDEEEIPF